MLFGTSGIRGLYGEMVNEELALKIGNIFAAKYGKDIVIGRDTRETGETLSNAAISGVLAAGRDAIDCGIVPTPTLALATRNNKCNGIMITASHNPPEYNGLKLFANGLEVSRKIEKEIEEEFESGFEKGKPLSLVKWDSVGKLKQSEGENAIAEHKKLIIRLVDAKLITKKKPKIVVDSNGAGAVITPSLLHELGCEVVSINSGLRGFSRISEPNSENLKGLAESVRSSGADLGIGHDGDADRAVIVDETGTVLPLDVQLAIMIESELSRTDAKARLKTRNTKLTVISTVEASLCIREVVENMGAELLVTPVGSLYVSEELERTGAIFGGEPCGEYVFADGIHAPDGILAAAKFVEIFCKNGKLSVLRKKYKTYPMIREKIKCENSKKYEIVSRVRKLIKTKGKTREDDGIRVDEPDGWFLIRASGTEPYVRLTSEYKTKDALEKRCKELRQLIETETHKQ